LKFNWRQSVTFTANVFIFHVVVIICFVAEIGWSLRAWDIILFSRSSGSFLTFTQNPIGVGSVSCFCAFKRLGSEPLPISWYWGQEWMTFCTFFPTRFYGVHKDDFTLFSYSYVVFIFISICSFVSSPFLCFVPILPFHATLPRSKCDCDISSQRHVYSATGCP
jgi:hypothetical protein